MPQDDVVRAAAQGISLAATGLFAGAALFVSAVDVPSGAVHYASFPSFYARAAKLQGGLAFLGSHAGMIAAAKAATRDEKLGWRSATLLLGAVWPWTVFVMMPTNKTILKQDAKGEAEQAQLIDRWARLHWVRTGLSVTSLAVMLTVVLGASKHS